MTNNKLRIALSTLLIISFVFILGPHAFAQNDPVRIMPCGDSITYDNYSGDSRPVEDRFSYRPELWYLLQDAGYSVDFVGSVAAGQNAGSDFDPDNEGHPGWRDDQIADNIFNWLTATPADIVLLHIGTNGLNTSPDDVKDILDEIDRYETVNGVEVTVLLARIINRMNHTCPDGSTTTTFNTNVETMALDRVNNPANDAYPDKITMVDMECGANLDYAQDQTAPYEHDMWDSLHPNDAGYIKMAELWYAHLMQILPRPCPAGMVSYWKLDETVTPSEYEDIFADNPGELPAGRVFPTPTTDGRVNGAQVFDGTTNGIDVAGDDYNWGQTDSFTIEFWMRRDSEPIGGGGTSNNEVIVGRDDTSLHWWFGIWNDGRARFQMGDADHKYEGLYGPVVDDGSWHHLVGVRNGATNYLYVDGELAGSESPAYTTGFGSDSAALNIGWLNLSPYYYFEGTLDELAVYNRALTPTEIQLHHSDGLNGRGYCEDGDFPDSDGDGILDAVEDGHQCLLIDDDDTDDDGILDGNEDLNGNGVVDPGEMNPCNDDSDSDGLQDGTEIGLAAAQGNDTGAGFVADADPATTTDPLDDDSDGDGVLDGDEDLNGNGRVDDGESDPGFNPGSNLPCPAEMISYHTLDDASAPYEDAMGGPDATCTNCPTSAVGLVAGAQQFDGADDEVNLADDNNQYDWAADASFTIEYWMKKSTPCSGNEVIVGRDDTGSELHWWTGCSNGTNQAVFQLRDVGYGGTQIDGQGAAINDGEWHHLVFVRDESNDENRIYLDGEEINQGTHNYAAGFGGSTPLNIGYLNLGGHYRYDGLLDEVAIYDRALTDSEIDQHRTDGLAGHGYCEPGGDTYNLTIAVDPAEGGTTTPAAGSHEYDDGMEVAIMAIPASGYQFDYWTGDVADPNSASTTVTMDEAQSVTAYFTTITGGTYDLTAYWKLDEAASSFYDDIIGDNDGGCPASGNCPNPTTDGKLGGGQVFDRSIETGIDVPGQDFNWGKDDSFTIAFWMNKESACSGTSTAANEVIVGRDDGNSQLHWWVGVGCVSSGAAGFNLVDENGGESNTQMYAETDLADGRWHHVVVQRDGDRQENRIYVDGKLEREMNISYSNGFASATEPVTIGMLNLTGGYNYTGTLDEVAIYNSAISESEIRSLFYLAGPRCSTPIRVMPLGDSITYDNESGDTRPEGDRTGYRSHLWWVLQAAGYTNVDFVGSREAGYDIEPPFDPDNEGWPGWTDDEIAENIYDNGGDNWLEMAANDPDQGPVDVILLHIGTNGLNASPDDVEDILDEIDEYEADTGKDVTVMLAMIINRASYSSTTTAFNVAVKEMAEARIDAGDKIIIVDMENGAGIDYGTDMSDNLHPNDPGYAKMSDAWLNGDSFGSLGLADILPVCGPPELAAPEFTSTPPLQAYNGGYYTYDVDADGYPAPEYRLTQAPDGMTIDSASGEINWFAGDIGDYDVTVEAFNSEGAIPQEFTIHVEEAPPCPVDMTAYYQLEEDSAPFEDSLGGIAATCTDCPEQSAGAVGFSQSFDGANDEVNVDAASGQYDWAADASFTIEYWMWKDTPCSGNEVIVGRDDSGSSLHWWTGCDDNGTVRFQLRDVNYNGPYLGGTGDPINNGQWHHLVFVRDESNNENRIYIDGEQTHQTTHDYTAGFGGSTPLNIGYLNLSGHYRYDGLLDEVAIYDRALTPTEIQQHYNGGLAGEGYCEEGVAATVEVRVATGSDDAEESTSGSMSLTSSDLELVYDGSDQKVGIRFSEVAIPQNANIVNAYVQFQVEERHSGATALTIEGEDIDDAPTFTSSRGNISSRVRTSANVPWSPQVWATMGAAGPDQRTPDISRIIQEIVSRTDWSSFNSLVVIITGTGERVAESYNGNQGGAPLLHVEYTTGSPINRAPGVDAGSNQTISLPENSVVLDGTVTDDGLPADPPGGVSTTWRQLSGPGIVVFDAADALDSTATFPGAGAYVLRLTADDGELTAGDEITIVVNEEGGEVVSVEVRVAAGSDDAEELASGSMSLTSSDLELVYDGSDQTVGIRFFGVDIPQGANIVNAYVQFQVDETNSVSTSLTIEGEDIDDAPTFTSSRGNISSRVRTWANVPWSPLAWTTIGAASGNQRTPDISQIIQEIVSRPGWLSFNSLVVIITGTGERVAESYNGNQGGAPLLHVEYNTGSPINRAPGVDAGSNQTITLPENSVILDGTVTDDGLPDPPGGVSTTWSQVSGPGIVTFDDDTAVDAIATFSEAGTYVLELMADDGELNAGDVVTIVVNEEGGEVVSVEVQVSSASDDAEESASGSMSLTSSDLELVDERSNQTVGIRFNGLNVPQGATIVNAYVQFQADETDPETTSLTIEGEDIENAATFASSSGNISSRARTSANVSWSPVPWTTVGEAGPDQRTPDVSQVIQEIVNRSGWSSGNSLAFIITGTGRRTAESYNGSQGGAPLLHLEYITGPSI